MPRPPEVHKFGGASLASPEAIASAVKIVLAHRPGPVVVVVSALAGVTDALLAGRRMAALRRRHSAVARTLFNGNRRKALLALVDDAFGEPSPRNPTSRALDAHLARGERVSARLVAAALQAADCPAEYIDATEVIKTDGVFGLAAPDLARTE